MPPPIPNKIYLAGFMGAGKSVVGARLASRLGFAFADTDDEIVRETGLGVAKIFEVRGEPEFRRLESMVLEKLEPKSRTVVALGGGTLIKVENQIRVFNSGTVVYLRATVPALAARLSSSNRPLVRDYQGAALENRIAAMLLERAPVYLRAPIIVDTDGLTIDAVVEAIYQKVGLNHAEG